MALSILQNFWVDTNFQQFYDTSNCAIWWYDMIWHDMILFAQNHGPKAELQSTIWEQKEKGVVWPETKLKVQR